MNAILVVGSAHLDVLARATSRDDVVDRIGSLSIGVGGTACNFAINLAHSGATVRLLSAMNDSAYSKMIEAYLLEMKVDPYIDYYPDMPTGGFCSHIDTKGEMFSAISSTPVELVNFESGRIAAAMDGVKAVLIDCNLSSVAINRLVTFANDRNIAVYIAAVSEEKSLRIAGVSGRIKGIFINLKEYRFFCRSVLEASMPPSMSARALQSTLVVTEGAAGATVAFPDGTVKHIAPATLPDDGAQGSRLGMGDAFAAGMVLLHEIHGLSMENAARGAVRLASRVGSSDHCHPGKAYSLESAIDRLQHSAGHDAMTGVLNRHRTEQALSKALERRRKNGQSVLSVLMLDIDHFKSINDSFGHNVGDEVIINVTKAAQKCLRETDYMGRWGGEEFMIVLPDTAREAALVVAERVRVAVEFSVRHPRPVTVSLGCSEAAGAAANDLLSLVESADKALYKAKHSGRNRVVCASQLT